MILAERIGCNSLIIESDSTVAVEAFNQQEAYFGPEAAIIRECRQMELEFAKTSCVHCFREANTAPHELAKYSFCNKTSDSWTDEPPACIVNSLVNDVILI